MSIPFSYSVHLMQVSLVYVLGNLVTRNKLPLQVCPDFSTNETL